ncbi:putative acid phosphatase [Yarrowia sp. C11]|nr:putative acid phosphatase [Yarrowia sp. E02]KAG5369689.1 putative acid phosphatase [Yarrowia sp. C11]
MKFSTLTVFLAASLFSSAEAKKKKNEFQPAMTTISPNLAEIAAAQATAVSNQYTSAVVPGCAFDKYYQVWLENTDYDKAFQQEDMAWLRSQGITLTNYWALTHPSEPNYVGAVGGDYFGINNDDFFRVPENVFTIADLLDIKGISWAEYQEHQPYTGFQGMNFSRQADMAPDYVRKHNPLVHYDSVVNVPERLGNLKNFTEFNKDVSNAQIPQWAFITPNMTNDAHDTDIEFAGKWTRGFLEPLLANKEFMDNNLIIVTFDEDETYALENKVLAILIGGAVPKELQGTTDDTYYTHYSNLATVQANWQLPHLGRGDALANPFKFVADQLNISVVDYNTTGQYNNKSVVGYFNDERVPIPAPNASVIGVVGNTIYQKIADVWGGVVPKVATPSTCPKKVTELGDAVESPVVPVVEETPVSSPAVSPVSSPVVSPLAESPVAEVSSSTSIEGEYVTISSDCSSSANGTLATSSSISSSISSSNITISSISSQTSTSSAASSASASGSASAKGAVVAAPASAADEYTTVYVTDCPVTTVGANGEKTTHTVQSTVTETVCPKCTKKAEESKSAEETKTFPKGSPKAAPKEEHTTVTLNQTITKTQATTMVSSKTAPVQAPKLESGPAQANGAAQVVVGAVAALPALVALL